MRTSVVAPLVLFVVGGCSDSVPKRRLIASQPVGIAGGRIEAEGITLDIPPGALTTTE